MGQSREKLNEREELADRWEQLKCDERKYLERRGWTYTSQTPGCFWMFQRTLPDGRTVLMSQGEALQLDDHLDAILAPSPDAEHSSKELPLVLRIIQQASYEGDLRGAEAWSWDEIDSKLRAHYQTKPVAAAVNAESYTLHENIAAISADFHSHDKVAQYIEGDGESFSERMRLIVTAAEELTRHEPDDYHAAGLDWMYVTPAIADLLIGGHSPAEAVKTTLGTAYVDAL
jgi:hypothetical protein